MYHDASYHSASGLPHPEYDAQFYTDVPRRRLIAWVLDAVIIGLLTLIILIGTLGLAGFILPIVLIVLSFAYRVQTLRSGSATLGMRLVGIQLRDRRGLKFDDATAVLHTALYTFNTILLPLQLLSCVLMAKSRYGQGLHDMVLGTTAINTPANY